jgi:hypothetical protein
VNHTAGSVAPPNVERVQVGDASGQRAERRGLAQGAVRPVTAERTTLAPAAWKTASNAAVKKSSAGISCAWDRRNSAQSGPSRRSGSGVTGAPSGGARGPGASERSCRERRSTASPPAAPPGPSPRAPPATTHTGRRPARVPAPHPDRAAAGRSTRSPGVCREPVDPIEVDAMPGSGIYLLWGTEDGTPAVGTRPRQPKHLLYLELGTRRVAQPRRQSPL